MFHDCNRIGTPSQEDNSDHDFKKFNDRMRKNADPIDNATHRFDNEVQDSLKSKENPSCQRFSSESSIRIETKPNSSLSCLRCKRYLRRPVRLLCGHRQCQRCAETSDGDDVKCLECEKTTSKSKTAIDEDFCRQHERIQVECSECSWKGAFGEYNEHCKSVHENFQCLICHLQFSLRKEKAEHYHSRRHQRFVSVTVGRQKKGKHAHVTNESCESKPNSQVDMIRDAHEIAMYGYREVIGILSSGGGALEEELERIDRGFSQIQATIAKGEERLSQLKLGIQEQGAHTDGLKTNLIMVVQDFASFKQIIGDHGQTTYTGTFIWKITNFREKSIDAQSERQTSIYSSPFYSSPTGYKMCARLYLNGDGTARGTHMSAFFVLMRGPNDPILKFPFNYKVTFCLFDQTPARRHIVDSFRPDPKSNSFQRPRSEMNIGSGIPKFVPLMMVQQPNSPYVQDDTIFIKIMVDFDDMQRTVLPFALTLDPGLRMHVQRQMTEEHKK